MGAGDGVVPWRENAGPAQPVEELVRGDEDGGTVEPRIELPVEERIGAAGQSFGSEGWAWVFS
jgi:hypothetical protein